MLLYARKKTRFKFSAQSLLLTISNIPDVHNSLCRATENQAIHTSIITPVRLQLPSLKGDGPSGILILQYYAFYISRSLDMRTRSLKGFPGNNLSLFDLPHAAAYFFLFQPVKIASFQMLETALFFFSCRLYAAKILRLRVLCVLTGLRTAVQFYLPASRLWS